MLDYLRQRTKKEISNFVSTHTRIPDKELNIYAGSWCVNANELNEFWDKYYDYVFVQGNKEYLTEKQLPYGGCLAVDFDFRYNYDVTKRQHTKENVLDMICLYLDQLKEHFIIEESRLFPIYIFEKPNVNRLEDGSLTKDGIHMIIGLQVEHHIQMIIRDKMLTQLPEYWNLPLINSWESVLDEGISKGTTNWQLFGSQKPNNEAYQLKYQFVINYDNCDNEFMMKEQNISDLNMKEEFPKLSVQYPHHQKFELKQKHDPKPKRVLSPTSVAEIHNEKLSQNQELLDLVRIDKKDRTSWQRVCACIKYNGFTNDDWLEFCENNDLNMDEEKLELFNNLNPYPIEIHYLQSLAKKSNPKEYKVWLDKWNIYGISFNEVSDPYSCACKIKNTLKTTLKLCKEDWYMLTDNQLWKQQNEPTFYIIKEIHKYLDSEKDRLNYKSSQAEGEEKKSLITQMENWLKLYNVITKSGYLSVLTKTLRPLLTDDDFENKLDNNKGKLAFKNGIMDLETKTFREGIMWDDYITETIPYDYKPSSCDFVKSILLKILNNNEEHLNYYLSLLGYSFTGNADSEKSVYFMIDKTEDGKGDNGKTLFFDILNDLLPNYVYKSKSTFVLKKNTKAHKQLVKMKGKRLVWLEELPKEETNAELIKEIADGKTTENEVMFGTSENINIMFKMFILSNNIPNIKSNEEAVYNRYKQISFNSHFDRTGDRLEENPEKLEFIANTKLSQIIKEKYYNEVFNLIIEYANNYYKNGIPKVPAQFIKDTNDTKKKNNKFVEWFEDNCEKNENGKIALEQLVYLSGCNKDDIKSFMKIKGYKYNPDLSGLGKNNKGKAYKGGYIGININECEEE
jgi:phage/plasmid-associated DNA primase